MGRRKRNIDTISELPDDILLHILSFLPMICSARTCVLSKRWRFMWAHVPNLEFHSDFMDRRKKKKYLSIIERVISTHEAKILNTFSLSDVKGCADRLEALIVYAIEHSVRNLYLDFDFACKTLFDLKLDNCGVIPSSRELFLPSFKKLDLSFVEYEGKESLPHLFFGCPVLEELILKDAYRKEGNNIILKLLNI